MRRFCLSMLALGILTALAASASAADGKIRVLLTVGGHGFEEQAFYAMFDQMADVQYTKAQMPKDAGLLKPGLEKDYDVVAMYDMSPDITPQQQKDFVDLLNTGIGLVSLHHNMGAHRKWEEYRKIIGGKFIFEPCEIEGRKFTPSGWQHGQDMKISVADADHPITKGLSAFDIHDETYKGYYTAADVKVLLTTDHPKNDPSIAWVHQYAKSRVFYLMLGHDSGAYNNPNYRELVNRGIRWTAGK
jgi:type 1 glutamine amidotransferase